VSDAAVKQYARGESPQSTPRRRIAFIAEQFVPPVIDGSTYVYKNWIEFLAERHELYGVFFSSRGADTTAAEPYLSEHCAAHLILPGQPDSRSWKVLRAVVRLATGTLFAPRWIEELGRGEICRTIAQFVRRYEPEIFLVSKLASVPLFGIRNIRNSGAVFLLDMHDDFVRRDEMERRVLQDLLTRFPALNSYGRYRDMRIRQLLSRLAQTRARAQESRLCRLFDCVLASGAEEYEQSRDQLRGTVPCELIGWPLPPAAAAAPSSSPRAPTPFHAGFIGGDYPFNLEGVIFFLERVLPLIHAQCPDFKILIAGHIATPLSLLGARWRGVTLCGYVPDARHFYEQIGVCVIPILSGTGVSVKLLEALDYGRPVAVTRAGARGLAGIAANPRVNIADEPDAFARCVVSLCERAAAGLDDDGECALRRQHLTREAFEAAFARVLGNYDARRIA
jgi:glycosyltransferase involved in cell wall biosynthesis